MFPFRLKLEAEEEAKKPVLMKKKVVREADSDNDEEFWVSSHFVVAHCGM
jgi:hypothetical protein